MSTATMPVAATGATTISPTEKSEAVFTYYLPARDGSGTTQAMTTMNNIVLVGANGAGKTRLGAYIEMQMEQDMSVHRISAQRALTVPESARRENLKEASEQLFYGANITNTVSWSKQNYRWQDQRATSLLDDFEKLLSLLFAKTVERDRLHTEATKLSKTYIEVPDAPIDIIISVWNKLLPHRKISFDDGKVYINLNTAVSYHGKEMSDGERIILYLLGQCLCAPDYSIIIIDEPEIHIHKSIVQELWNEIETLCARKLIIYITHDLDFAASRSGATKFWIKSFRGNYSWDWEELPNEPNLPDNLMLEVLGSRKKVLFCEGEKGSMDIAIYQAVYPAYHVIPRGGGDKVIEATKALRNNPALHHLNTVGLTDSDYKEPDEKAALLANGIYSISVAEIENLILIEPVLRIISSHLLLNADEMVDRVTQFIIDALNNELNVQVSSKAEKIITYRLGAFSKEANTMQGLIDGLATTNGRINVATIYQDVENEFRQAITNRRLNELLLVYNRKSLADRISHILGLSSGQYTQLVLRLLKSDQRQAVINAFAAHLPALP